MTANETSEAVGEGKFYAVSYVDVTSRYDVIDNLPEAVQRVARVVAELSGPPASAECINCRLERGEPTSWSIYRTTYYCERHFKFLAPEPPEGRVGPRIFNL